MQCAPQLNYHDILLLYGVVWSIVVDTPALLACYGFVHAGYLFQSCGHPSLTGLTYMFTTIYVQNCGHPSLIGLIYLFLGIYLQNCGHPSLTALIYLCTWTNVQSFGHPTLTRLILFVYRDLCPKLWTHKPNWLDIVLLFIVEWRQNIKLSIH